MTPTPPPRTLLPAGWATEAAAYDLCLFVSGATPLSARAIVNIRRICDEHLAGRHLLEIVDVSQHPGRAATDQIFATPTLLRRAPLPPRRFIGDMSATHRVLDRLGLADGHDPASPR